jgi:hypothetical protein
MEARSAVRSAVTFRFGGPDYEVRYLSQPPEVGNLVTHVGALWVVVSVHTDEEHGFVIADCEFPVDDDAVGRGNV